MPFFIQYRIYTIIQLILKKGNEVEWKGSWADSSREWNSVSDEEKEEIGLNFDRDGEFWLVKIF